MPDPWARVQHGSRDILCVKVAHRLALLPPPRDTPIRVLDAFAGEGDIWRAVARWRPDLEIMSIEADPNKGTGRIRGDNRRVMAAMDLSDWDVLDLDAWGQPTDQLAIAKEQGFEGVVFWTFNATYPRGSNHLVEASGIPRSWIQLAPSAVFSHGGVWDLWKMFLARHGYDRMIVCSIGRGRNYGACGYATWDEQVYTERLQTVLASTVGLSTTGG